MKIEIKGILKKSVVEKDFVIVGKQKINIEDIIEIKYQRATTMTQGFITYCTENNGKEVTSLNNASLNKNTIMFYKKQNESLDLILDFFNEKNIVINNIGEIQKQEQKAAVLNAIKEKEEFKEEGKRLQESDELFCPKCHSKQVTYAGRKVSVGKAVVGGVAFGGVGAVLGGLSGKKGNMKCLKCGHTYKI